LFLNVKPFTENLVVDVVVVCRDLEQLLAEEEKAKKAQIGIWNPNKKNAIRQITEKFDFIQFFTNNQNKPLHGQCLTPYKLFVSFFFFLLLFLFLSKQLYVFQLIVASFLLKDSSHLFVCFLVTAIVEQVKTGTKLKLYLVNESQYIIVNLSGAQSPVYRVYLHRSITNTINI
jgi:hypothetical protein